MVVVALTSNPAGCTAELFVMGLVCVRLVYAM